MNNPELETAEAIDNARRAQVLWMALAGGTLAMAAVFASSAFVHSQVSRDERVEQVVRDEHAIREQSDLKQAALFGVVGIGALAKVSVPMFRRERVDEPSA